MRLLRAQGQDPAQIAIDVDLPVVTVDADLRIDMPKPATLVRPFQDHPTPAISGFA